MGHYRIKKASGDGNCFFYALRDLLESEGRAPLPAHDELRRAIANQAALDLFARDYDDLAQRVEQGANFDRVEWRGQAQTYKDALNSHIRRVGGKQTTAHQLGPNQAALFVALLGQSDRAGLARFGDRAGALDLQQVVDEIVWADVDEGHFGGLPPGGVVWSIAQALYFPGQPALQLVTHADLSNMRALVHKDTDHVYLYYDWGHFESLIWTDEDPAVLEIRSSAPHGQRGPTRGPTALKVSRGVQNTLAGSVLFGAVTWNINHLGAAAVGQLLSALTRLSGKSPKRRRSTRRKRKNVNYQDYGEGNKASSIELAEKVAQKLRALEELVRANSDWVDAISLQEVGLGIEYLGVNTVEHYRQHRPMPGLEGGELYTCHRGPQLQSIAASSLRAGQIEYYPLLIPRHRRARPEIQYLGWTAVFAGVEAVDGNDSDGQALYWCKRSAYARQSEVQKKIVAQKTGGRFYRPVVVHRLRVGDQRVNVAAVHTTPSGIEFERTEVFFQVNDFFQRAGSGELDRAEKGERRDLWVVTGDYYLFGEAAVFSRSALKAGRPDSIMTRRIEEYVAKSVQAWEDENRALLDAPPIARDGGEVEPLDPNNRKRKRQFDEDEDAEDLSEALEAAIEELGKVAELETMKEKIDAIVAVETVLLSARRANPRKRSNVSSSPKTDSGDEVREHQDDGEGSDDESDREGTTDQEEDEVDQDAEIVGNRYFERARRSGRSPFNQLRNVLGYSFAERIRDTFQIVQPPAGTNVHASARLEKDKDDRSPREGTWGQDQSIDHTSFRVADFFVIDHRWASVEAGLLVRRTSGGMVWVDDEGATESQRWRELSDHFPMGVRLSTAPLDGRVENAARTEKREVRAMARLYETASAVEGGVAALALLTETGAWKRGPDNGARAQLLERYVALLQQVTRSREWDEGGGKERLGLLQSCVDDVTRPANSEE